MSSHRTSGTSLSPQSTSTEPTGEQGAENSVEKRYGRSQAKGVSGKILIIIFVAAMVFAGAFIFNQWRNSTPANATLTAVDWDAVDDHKTNFTFDITRRDVYVDSYCIMVVLDYSMNEVGRREVLIPAGGPESQRMTLELPTFAKGYAAKPYGCSDAIPAYLTDPAQQVETSDQSDD